MKKRYKLISAEGVEHAIGQGNPQAELDQVAQLELTVAQERALIAAGWIEGPVEKKKDEEG